MAHVQIGYDTNTGVFTIPDKTSVHGPSGTAQAIAFTQAPGSTGWSLSSINFANSQFSQTSGNGSEITVRDAFTDTTKTDHKFTVTITVNTTPPSTVTSPDPDIVNDPITPEPSPKPHGSPSGEPKPKPE
jgi:hypothetical protein